MHSLHVCPRMEVRDSSGKEPSKEGNVWPRRISGIRKSGPVALSSVPNALFAYFGGLKEYDFAKDMRGVS